MITSIARIIKKVYDHLFPGSTALPLQPPRPGPIGPPPVPGPVPGPVPPAPPAPPAPPEPVVGLSHAELAELLALVNAVRSANRPPMPPLALDSVLCEVAGDYAEMMAEGGTFEHGDYADRIWSVHPNTAIGEDLAEGPAAMTPAQVVAMWEASPAHRAILVGKFSLIGFGRSIDHAGVSRWVADLDRA